MPMNMGIFVVIVPLPKQIEFRQKILQRDFRMIYRIDNFTEKSINPVTHLPFDDSWIVYCLTNSEDYNMLVGSGNSSLYTVKVSRKFSDWKMSICDFMQFHKSRNKNIILSVSQEDLKCAKEYYAEHKYNDNFLRENEPEVLVHSTTYENWLSIKKDRCLKSWNILKKEKLSWEEEPIGSRLGDPADFSDFIMFSSGGISGEIVVSSKQNKKIVMDQDKPYKTGVRLYFDIKKIAENGLLIRDGIHLKVADELPLDPYLIWCATWDKVGLTSSVSTPKEFAEKSNNVFNSLFGGNISSDF